MKSTSLTVMFLPSLTRGQAVPMTVTQPHHDLELKVSVGVELVNRSDATGRQTNIAIHMSITSFRLNDPDVSHVEVLSA